MKTCKLCGATHPKEDFPKESRLCRVCKKEQVRSASAAWRARHPERAKAVTRESKAAQRERDPEGHNAYRRDYAQRCAPVVRAQDTRRRARERNAVTQWERELDLLVDKEAAALCKLRAQLLGGKWAVDHVIPLTSKVVSGLHNPYNLAVVPHGYNSSKRNTFRPEIVGQPLPWLPC